MREQRRNQRPKPSLRCSYRRELPSGVSVSCGHCEGCTRRAELMLRDKLRFEITAYTPERCHFVTLTFQPDELVYGPQRPGTFIPPFDEASALAYAAEFRKRVQKGAPAHMKPEGAAGASRPATRFMFRFHRGRHRLEAYVPPGRDLEFRHFTVVERGSERGKLHLHMLLFWRQKPPPIRYLIDMHSRFTRGSECEVKTIAAQAPNGGGAWSITRVVNYVAKYAVKGERYRDEKGRNRSPFRASNGLGSAAGGRRDKSDWAKTLRSVVANFPGARLAGVRTGASKGMSYRLRFPIPMSAPDDGIVLSDAELADLSRAWHDALGVDYGGENPDGT